MRADLHLHTHYSDGSYSPAEVARRAREAGVSLISMTDHDSMEGMEEKAAAAEAQGLLFVRGWEVSAYANGKVHVLGYRCTAGEAYRRFYEARMRGARVRAEEMLAKANAHLGLCVTMEEVERKHLKKEAPLHTMHVVKTFAERLGKSLQEVYETYFEKGRPAYSELERPSPEDAIDVIHACGGLAVLAHPARIPLDTAEREALMDALAAYGLDGIECSHSTHTASETEYFKAYARRKGLLETGGSDFHAEGERVPGLPEFYPSGRLLAALGLS